MYTDFLAPIAAGDNEFAKFAKLQAQARLACVNAGISIPMDNPLLDDVRSGDTDLQKFQKVNAWLTLLAQNVSGGGGTGNLQSGTVALTNGVSSVAVVFSPAFASAPDVTAFIHAPNSSGYAIGATADESTRTTAGVTFLFSAAIPASGYKLSWFANV